MSETRIERGGMARINAGTNFFPIDRHAQNEYLQIAEKGRFENFNFMNSIVGGVGLFEATSHARTRRARDDDVGPGPVLVGEEFIAAHIFGNLVGLNGIMIAQYVNPNLLSWLDNLLNHIGIGLPTISTGVELAGAILLSTLAVGTRIPQLITMALHAIVSGLISLAKKPRR